MRFALSLSILTISLVCGWWSLPLHAQALPAAAPAEIDVGTLARIRDAAMASDYAYQRLADLSDKIGPRLSGSAGAEAAVAYVAAAMKAEGLTVSLQPVKVPHWVRGLETGELVGL